MGDGQRYLCRRLKQRMVHRINKGEMAQDFTWERFSQTQKGRNRKMSDRADCPLCFCTFSNSNIQSHVLKCLEERSPQKILEEQYGSSSEPNFCAFCGTKKIASSAKFCSQCGKSFSITKGSFFKKA